MARRGTSAAATAAAPRSTAGVVGADGVFDTGTSGPALVRADDASATWACAASGAAGADPLLSGRATNSAATATDAANAPPIQPRRPLSSVALGTAGATIVGACSRAMADATRW